MTSKDSIPPVPLHREAGTKPTYDHRVTGDRFSVEVYLNDHRVSTTPCPDPFHHTRLTIGWWDLLRCVLRRRAEVVMVLGGDSEIVEDVMELNDDYKGAPGSTRREEWQRHLEDALKSFVAPPEVSEDE